MTSYLYNPCKVRRNPARKPKTARGKKWMSLVKKYGIKEAARRWDKRAGKPKSRKSRSKTTRKKGAKKMARRKKRLSAAHRRAISRGLRKAADGRRRPLSPAHRRKISRSLRRAADGRRRPLSPAHRRKISRSLRRAADGRRRPLSAQHRARISRGIKRAWRSGAYRGARLGRRQPVFDSIRDLFPSIMLDAV